MFHQAMGRRRDKGSKVKNILQATVLVAVVFWLLYQTKHSYERKTGYNETGYDKLSKEESDIKFGRKVNAGFNNGISIQPQENNSEEFIKTRETEVDQDAFHENPEEKEQEDKTESEESQEDITDSGKEETQRGKEENVDDNSGSDTAREVNTEDMIENLHLPSQTETDNFGQNINENEDGATTTDDANSSNEKTVTSDETSNATNQSEADESAGQGTKASEIGVATNDNITNQTETDDTAGQGTETNEIGGETNDHATDQTVTDENAGQGAETSENGGENNDNATERTQADESTAQGNGTSEIEGENNNNASPEAEETSNSVVSDNQRNKDISAESTNKEEAIQAQEDNGPKVDASHDPRSDLEVRDNLTLPHSAEENNVVVLVDNVTPKEVEPQVASDSQAETAGNSSVESGTTEGNEVMTDSNGVPRGKEGEKQVDGTSEGQATGSRSTEAVTVDTSSEGETNATREKSTVMPDVNGAPKDEEVQSQTDHVSEGEKAENSSSNVAKAETTNEQSNSEKSSEAANSTDAEATTNNTVAEENDSKSSEAANSSVSKQNESIELPENEENSVAEKVQSQGNSTPAEGMSEKSEEVVIDSVQNNDQNNPDLPANETLSEVVASHEDSTSNDGNTSKNDGDLESKDETHSEAVASHEYSASNDENTSKNDVVGKTEPESEDATTTDQ